MYWIDKKRIRDCLKELSDIYYQERVWLASSGPEVSSLSEATCQLFGDSGLDFSLDRNQEVYGKKVDDLLRDFRAVLQKIPDNRPPSELIKDEKMIPVRKMAADILKLIEQQNKMNAEIQRIVGARLNSVEFVMDYLILGFGPHGALTALVWPEIIDDKTTSIFGHEGYRDKLCSLIECVVKNATVDLDEVISIVLIGEVS